MNPHLELSRSHHSPMLTVPTNDKQERPSAYEELCSSFTELKTLAEKIDGHQRSWFSYFRGRHQDLAKFDHQVTEQIGSLAKKVGKLSENEKINLGPVVAIASDILTEMEKNCFVTNNQNRLQSVQDLTTIIHHHVPQSNSLFNLIQFSDIGQKFKSISTPSTQLLTKVNGKLSFVPVSKVNQEQMTDARDYFLALTHVLSDSNLINHMTVKQMMEIETMINWQFLNFLSLMPKGLDYNEDILNTLQSIRLELHKHLANRDPKEFQGILQNEKTISCMRQQQYIKKNFYNDKFWNEQGRSPLMLLKHSEDLVTYIDLIGHPEKKEHSGLTFINANREAGVAVYQNQAGELVISCSGGDSYANYLNFLQDRDASLGVGGMLHKPVADRAVKAIEAVQKIIKEEDLEGKPTIAMGLGMNGAVAELIAFKMAKIYPEVSALSFGLGVAPYLDKNSAAKMKRQENFHAMNFVYEEDRNLKTSVFSSLVAKGYGIEQADIYPVYNPDKFLRDVTGHNAQNYLCHVETAVKIPLMMFEINNELNAMMTMTQLSSEKQVEALQEMYTTLSKNI